MGGQTLRGTLLRPPPPPLPALAAVAGIGLVAGPPPCSAAYCSAHPPERRIWDPRSCQTAQSGFMGHWNTVGWWPQTSSTPPSANLGFPTPPCPLRQLQTIRHGNVRGSWLVGDHVHCGGDQSCRQAGLQPRQFCRRVLNFVQYVVCQYWSIRPVRPVSLALDWLFCWAVDSRDTRYDVFCQLRL